MKCRKCGAQIPDGSLYCMECGADIHIVPDFEPEIERNLQETMQNIVETFRQEDSEKEIPQERAVSHKEQRKKQQKHSWRVVSLLVILLVAACIGGKYFYAYYHSFAYQVTYAERMIRKGNYEQAQVYYEKALQQNRDSVSLQFALSDVYFQNNNEIEYEHLLRKIIVDTDATTEQLESAYGKLIDLYRSREAYETIDELLQSCSNDIIRDKFQNYIALPPTFSLPQGVYDSVQPLKLLAQVEGVIYYTTDGTDPDKTSKQYQMPILLEEGDYVIKACLINAYGIASECVSQQYHILDEKPDPPRIEPVSGIYTTPTDIVTLDETENIYYTIDGSDPTRASARYTEPIPMPIGTSTFRFVRIEDAEASEVVERTFQLQLETVVSVQDAEWCVIEYAMNLGRIQDAEGYIYDHDDHVGQFKYEVQFAKKIGDSAYYVIAEILRRSDGFRNPTGKCFAVDINTKHLYELQTDDNNNYVLVAIENEL